MGTPSAESSIQPTGDPSRVAVRVADVDIVQPAGSFLRQPAAGKPVEARFPPPKAKGLIEDELHLQFFIEFVLELRQRTAAVEGDSAPLAKVEAVFAVRYTLAPGAAFSDDDLAAFFRFNGPLTTVPYWREFVNSTLLRAGIDPVSLPPFVPGRHGLWKIDVAPIERVSRPSGVKSEHGAPDSAAGS
jgi:hypothetical protein